MQRILDVSTTWLLSRSTSTSTSTDQSRPGTSPSNARSSHNSEGARQVNVVVPQASRTPSCPWRAYVTYSHGDADVVPGHGRYVPREPPPPPCIVNRIFHLPEQRSRSVRVFGCELTIASLGFVWYVVVACRNHAQRELAAIVVASRQDYFTAIATRKSKLIDGTDEQATSTPRPPLRDMSMIPSRGKTEARS